MAILIFCDCIVLRNRPLGSDISHRKVNVGIKKASLFSEALLFGDPTGARTLDPYIKSVLLYQLSYRVMPLFGTVNINSFSALPKMKVKMLVIDLSRIIPVV